MSLEWCELLGSFLELGDGELVDSFLELVACESVGSSGKYWY